MMSGYMGLVEPYEASWADGRRVTVYPNGEVIDRDTGYYVRKPQVQANVNTPSMNYSSNALSPQLIFGCVVVLAIVAMVIASARK